MITKITPDKQKAISLLKMSKSTLERLEATDKEKYASNTLTDYYESLHKIMEALALLDGIKTRGDGAHAELINYLAKTKHINEQERKFIHQLREFRNKVQYEGVEIKKNYLILHEDRIIKIIMKLSGKIKY